MAKTATPKTQAKPGKKPFRKKNLGQEVKRKTAALKADMGKIAHRHLGVFKKRHKSRKKLTGVALHNARIEAQALRIVREKNPAIKKLYLERQRKLAARRAKVHHVKPASQHLTPAASKHPASKHPASKHPASKHPASKHAAKKGK